MRLPAVLLIALLLPARLGAEVSEYTLRNGLKVLVSEDHKSPLAVFQVWYRVGSRNETSGKSGISHLLEHMMFKGTPKYPSKVLSRTVQRYGGTDNAFTTRDYTLYYQILPSDKIELSMRFESDRMRNLALDEKETASERDVVMEERRMRYEDDPEASLYEEVLATAFRVHPYHWPVIGWMSDLASIGRDDLARHYMTYYSPGNTVIIVAGDIIPEEVIKKIGEYFSGIKPGPPIESRIGPEPPQRGEKRVYLRREAELPYLIAAYRTPVFTEKDSFALEVLASVLSGKSGRLYKSLVYEKKLALGSSADYNILQKDPYVFMLDATAAPGVDPLVLEKALYEEIEAIKKEPPSEAEVQKTKNKIEATFIMGQDAIFFQGEVLGWFEMLGGWRLKDKYLEEIRNVTPEDVQRVARKYFVEDNRTTGVLLPEDKKAPPDSAR